MAMADYRQCDVCGCKAFYDAHLNYQWETKNEPIPKEEQIFGSPGMKLDYLGDWAVLCTDCAKTHECVIESKEKSAPLATYDSEHALVIAQVGDCCGGGDPLCGGGCLVQKALMRNSAAPAQPIETGPTYRNIEAKRLRRLCALVGLSNAIPETDRELHDCMFSVLGMICRKVAEERPINDCGKD